MMVANSTILHDSVIFIRDTLLSKVTDPKSATRPSNEKFVMTSYPERTVTYPIITVKCNLINDYPIAMGTEQRKVFVSFEIRVWTRDQKTKDSIVDEVYDELTNYQIHSGEANSVGLYQLRINSMNDLDESGEGGVKSKIIEGTYLFIKTA